MKSEITKIHKEIFKESPASIHFMPGVMPIAGEHIEAAGGQALLLPIQHGVALAISETQSPGITIYDTLSKTKKSYPLMPHALDPSLPYEEKLIHALFIKLNKERGTTDKSYNITVMPSLDDYAFFHLEQAKLLLLTFVFNQYLAWNITYEKMIKYTNDVYINQLKTISHKASMMAMLHQTPKNIMLINASHDFHEAHPFPFKDYAFYAFMPTKAQDNQNKLCKNHQAVIDKAEIFFDKLRDIKTLCDLDLDSFNRYKLDLGDNQAIRYTEHIFYEHTRINSMVDTLEEEDMDWFEEFINESQTSLKDLFDIRYDDINFLVETTLAHGAIAARSINKGCRKDVLAIFKKPLNKTDKDSFMARFYTLHNNPLEIVLIHPNEKGHTL